MGSLCAGSCAVPNDEFEMRDYILQWQRIPMYQYVCDDDEWECACSAKFMKVPVIPQEQNNGVLCVFETVNHGTREPAKFRVWGQRYQCYACKAIWMPQPRP